MRIVAVRLAVRGEFHAVADAGVLVDDGVADIAIPPDADGDRSIRTVGANFLLRLVIVGAHHHDVFHVRVLAEDGADTNNTAAKTGVGHKATIADHHVVNVTTVDFRSRQIAGVGVDRRGAIEEIEGREWLRQREVSLEESAHGADVLPVALENVAEEPRLAEQSGDDLFAEILHAVVQRTAQHLAAENVDAHGGEAALLHRRRLEFLLKRRAHREAVDHFRILGFLDELGDRKVIRHAHQTESFDARYWHGCRRDGDVGVSREMLRDDLSEIHPVELIAGKNQHELVLMTFEMDEVAANGVGGAFIPSAALVGLLGGEDVDETGPERIKLETLLDMPMERSSEKLREEKDPVVAGVDAIADRDVDQTILTRQWDRWLASLLGKRKQPRAAAATHDHCEDSFGFNHMLAC